MKHSHIIRSVSSWEETAVCVASSYSLIAVYACCLSTVRDTLRTHYQIGNILRYNSETCVMMQFLNHARYSMPRKYYQCNLRIFEQLNRHISSYYKTNGAACTNDYPCTLEGISEYKFNLQYFCSARLAFQSLFLSQENQWTVSNASKKLVGERMELYTRPTTLNYANLLQWRR